MVIIENEKYKELLMNSDRFKDIVEYSRDIVYFADSKGNFTYISPRISILGYQPQDLIGKSPFELTHPDDVAEAQRAFDRTLTAGEYSPTIFRLRRKDGEYVWYEDYRSTVKKAGSAFHVVGILRDVSRRIQGKQELDFKNVLLEAQAATCPEGILCVDHNGRSVLFNRRFGEMWSIPDNILSSKNDDKMLGCVLPQLSDPDEFINKVRYLYAHTDESSHDMVRFKDGRVFERDSSPLTGGEGEYYGRIWFFKDITEHEKAEDELEARVTDRTSELEHEVAERKKTEAALKERMREMEILNEATIGREIKMIDLEKEVNSLLVELGRGPKYRVL
ncbi:MAG: PAS domain S-box protein [Candidatus Margulisbacteria bacterium]|nr:PAS domain S-box protein [Candidatus Margulisiibacteriota bacterium]